MAEYGPQANPIALRATSPEPAMLSGSIELLIGRIEEAVDAETARIRTDVHFDIRASNARKSRALYELTRAIKGAGEAVALNANRDGLARLRHKLKANEAAILAHLDAVSEVVRLTQDAIRHAETDGTYCAATFGASR